MVVVAVQDLIDTKRQRDNPGGRNCWQGYSQAVGLRLRFGAVQAVQDLLRRALLHNIATSQT